MVSVVEVATLPVVETFGPTVQGEGSLAGLPTYFVRLGYCDYRCSWCDSMYAVEPKEVGKNAERLTEEAIVERLDALPRGPRWVTISGGNPAIHDLKPLLDALHDSGYRVTIETQGSYWRDWIASLDHLTVSPKPPSSGMVSRKHREQTSDFMARAQSIAALRCLKIVVFDEVDLEWAKDFIAEWRGWGETFLSVGTDRPKPLDFMLGDAEVRRIVCERTRWLFERVAADPVLADVRVIPQLHVLAWGHARAV